MMGTPFHIDRLFRRGMNGAWNLDLVTPCEYVNDDEEVLAVVEHEGKLVGAKVTVECAAGVHARVKGELASGWYHVNDLARLKKKEKQSA